MNLSDCQNNLSSWAGDAGQRRETIRKERAMTQEIDDKFVAKENDRTAADAASAFNSVELLQGNAAAAATNASREAHGIKDVVGKLEITDNSSVNSKEIFEKGSYGFKNQLEKFMPLTRTENLILNNLDSAIRSGKLEGVQDMLRTLAENPRSIDRVLSELNTRLGKENALNSASWEQGRDNNGNEFVRLHLNHRDDYSKSAGGTEVTIGSDGRNSATYRKQWDSPAAQVEPSSQMWMFGDQWAKPGNSNDYSQWKEQHKREAMEYERTRDRTYDK
jgi:hypothetical protein